MYREDIESTLAEDCILETARLILRRPRPADAECIAGLAHDRAIAENTSHIPHPYSPAEARRWIELARNAGPERQAFVAELAPGQIIGAGSISLRIDEDHPEIDYWLGSPYRGVGYATEIARAMVDHAFFNLGHETLGASCRVTNSASRRVLERCGFQWIGCGLRGSVNGLGSFPVDQFRLERRTWLSLISWRPARLSHAPAEPQSPEIAFA